MEEYEPLSCIDIPALSPFPILRFDIYDILLFLRVRVFIYFHGVNERDAGHCTPPSAAGATSFLRSICRDAIFAGTFILATYNLINQPSYRSYLVLHPLDSSRGDYVASSSADASFPFAFREDNFAIPAISLTVKWRKYLGRISWKSLVSSFLPKYTDLCYAWMCIINNIVLRDFASDFYLSR